MRKLMWSMFIGLALLGSGSARADIIDANITGDNNVSYWDNSTASWVGLSNTWQTSSFGANVTSSSNTMYFALSNDYTSPTNPVNGTNPTGLLASFVDTNGIFAQTGTNTLLSSSSTFLAVAVNPWLTNPPEFPTLPTLFAPPSTLNPTLLTGWSAPTNYGANGGPSLWTSANGTIPAIDPAAQWISLPPNTGYFESTTPYQIFSVNMGIGNVVAPEPPTALLFAFAGLMLVLFYRRKLMLA